MTRHPVRILLALLSLFCALAFPGDAQAQARDCTISNTDMVFGNYDPLETTIPLDTTSTMSLRCNRNTFVQIFFSTGSSGTFSQRTLRQGTSLLGYNFYFEPARISILGDGTGGSFFLQGTVGRRTILLPLYGRVPPGQDPSIGLHSDAIIVTMIF